MFDSGNPRQFTSRGFTGHEHHDLFGLVNMNGRIYDPHLARFLQADPFVEDEATLNRYTYSHNSPLVYFDPSGYTSGRDVLQIALAVVITVSTSGTGAGLFGLGEFATVFIGGALTGAISTGSLEGAVWGAFSALSFYAIGNAIGNAYGKNGSFLGTDYTPGAFAAKTLSHGVAGGMLTEVRGGKFGHGFSSSFVTAAASPFISGKTGLNDYAQTAVATIVGGTASSLSGGKFANGAITAAMAYSYNQLKDDGSGAMTKAEAEAEARALNESAQGAMTYTARPTAYGWTAQPTDLAALEAGVSVDMAESVYSASRPSACAAFCGALSPVLSAVAGDVSGNQLSRTLNSSIQVAEHSDKVLSILSRSTVDEVRGFAQGLSRAPTIAKFGLLVPASINNFKGCYSTCRTPYFQRYLD
jgi:RHS repeat-associated protein